MSKDLLECVLPWCDGQVRLVTPQGATEDDFFAVMCDECGLLGPFRLSKTNAIDAWLGKEVQDWN